ncbi:putative spectrin-like repeat protein [Ranid herpesvirus 3]|uniref:Putative spectrin-like repeat protein n=1 Tax=Ranid herpesvirus 3 TaxID=1987509 RepID=A0A1X9T5A5_9VIRU|nr:putative spectrin-like repeat protein [Ranid herpesvirus 3]ARR28877.1 putative spectrin-like repeat protein [Ranid herpesvirus 3]
MVRVRFARLRTLMQCPSLVLAFLSTQWYNQDLFSLWRKALPTASPWIVREHLGIETPERVRFVAGISSVLLDPTYRVRVQQKHRSSLAETCRC